MRVLLLDEVEEHDDVADDDADQADDAEEGHEAERRAHDVEAEQRPDHAERDRREDDQRLDGVAELEDQRQEDRATETSITTASCRKPLTCSSSSPPITSR